MPHGQHRRAFLRLLNGPDWSRTDTDRPSPRRYAGDVLDAAPARPRRHGGGLRSAGAAGRPSRAPGPLRRGPQPRRRPMPSSAERLRRRTSASWSYRSNVPGATGPPAPSETLVGRLWVLLNERRTLTTRHHVVGPHVRAGGDRRQPRVARPTRRPTPRLVAAARGPRSRSSTRMSGGRRRRRAGRSVGRCRASEVYRRARASRLRRLRRGRAASTANELVELDARRAGAGVDRAHRLRRPADGDVHGASGLQRP